MEQDDRGLQVLPSGYVEYKRRSNGPSSISYCGFIHYGDKFFRHREEGPACYSPSTRKAYYYTRGELQEESTFLAERAEKMV